MKYKVLYPFADLHDKKYKYNAGDMFPRKGLEVSEDRIKELAGSENKLKKPLIEEIIDKTTKEAPEADEAPEKTAKKTTKRKNKNADRTVQRTE